MNELAIIPKPLSIKKSAEIINFDGRFKIIADSKCKKIAEQLKLVLTTAARADKKIRLNIDPNLKTLGEEGYHLTVNESGFMLTAYALPGIFYATRSLWQLLPAEFEIGQIKKFSLPALKIEDYPRFPWRGFSLDSARHFQPVALIKTLIDRMASLKLNRLHWHFMDNESCRIELEGFPELAKHALSADSPGVYSPQEVQEIIDYAAKRYIKVYPEIEIPGHCHSVLNVYPELRCQSEPMGKAYKQYCLGNPEVIVFLKKLTDEIIKIFKPEFLHIGGDEARTTHWENCSLCRKQFDDLKLENFNQYQKFFMKKISDYVVQQIPECIEWSDHLELNIPKQQIIQTWHESEAEEALAAGHRIICSEHEFVYFDYPQYKEEPMPFDFMLLLDIETVYKFEPVPSNTENPDLVLGGEACIWTEIIPADKLFDKVFPRLFAFAETVWSDPAERSFKEFLPRVNILSKRFDILEYKG
jgi:hexosaminidase